MVGDRERRLENRAGEFGGFDVISRVTCDSINVFTFSQNLER